MTDIIKPSVGRKVWVYESAQHAVDVEAGRNEAFDGTIIATHSDNCISVRAYDHSGTEQIGIGLTLRQPGDPMPNGPHAGWMPYQVQASQSKFASFTSKAEHTISQDVRSIEGGIASAIHHIGEVIHRGTAGELDADQTTAIQTQALASQSTGEQLPDGHLVGEVQSAPAGDAATQPQETAPPQ